MFKRWNIVPKSGIQSSEKSAKRAISMKMRRNKVLIHSVLLKRLWNRWKPINIYIKAKTSCGSMQGLSKWRSNFAFSIFLPLSLSFSILIRAVMVPNIFTFQFCIKKWEYTIWLIHQYFILFFFFDEVSYFSHNP